MYQRSESKEAINSGSDLFGEFCTFNDTRYSLVSSKSLNSQCSLQAFRIALVVENDLWLSEAELRQKVIATMKFLLNSVPIQLRSLASSFLPVDKLSLHQYAKDLMFASGSSGLFELALLSYSFRFEIHVWLPLKSTWFSISECVRKHMHLPAFSRTLKFLRQDPRTFIFLKENPQALMCNSALTINLARQRISTLRKYYPEHKDSSVWGKLLNSHLLTLRAFQRRITRGSKKSIAHTFIDSSAQNPDCSPAQPASAITSSTNHLSTKRKLVQRVRSSKKQRSEAFQSIWTDLSGNLENQSAAVDEMNLFRHDMQRIRPEFCRVCHERSLVFIPYVDQVCKRCARDTHKVKLFSNANNLHPCPIPALLTNLSPLEEMIIAQVVPVMHCYYKKGGQRGYSGNVISLPQDLEELCKRLPRRVSDIPLVYIRRYGIDDTYKDFFVRRQTVWDALIWLKINNPLYHDIIIDEDRLRDLPVSGVPGDIEHIDECPPSESLEVTENRNEQPMGKPSAPNEPSEGRERKEPSEPSESSESSEPKQRSQQSQNATVLYTNCRDCGHCKFRLVCIVCKFHPKCEECPACNLCRNCPSCNNCHSSMDMTDELDCKHEFPEQTSSAMRYGE